MLAESTAVSCGGVANNTMTPKTLPDGPRPKNHEIINYLLGNLPDANLLD
jgi:hypothetical protein